MAMAILRVKKLKTAGAIQKVGIHNSRSQKTLNASPSIPNRVLIPADGSEKTDYAKGAPGKIKNDNLDAVKSRIISSDANVRKNGVLACEIFLGASPEFFRPNGGAAGTFDPQQLNSWVPASMQWLRDEWGESNVVSAILHLDETTPHIHAIVVPIDPDTGRMNAARWLNGRQALSEMQDRYAETMETVGLERGVRGSAANHTDVRAWYGHLQQPLNPVPEPIVQVPGMLLSKQSREEYAARESERIKELQREPLAILESQARERHIAATRRRESEFTNRRLAKELEVERTNRKNHEAKLAQENEGLRTKQADMRKQLDSFRRIPLSEAASWFDREELVEAGVKIGTDAQGRERIFGADNKVIGRNAVDLAKHVHGCQTAEEAVAWIEIRQGEVAANTAIAGVAETLREDAQPIREQLRNSQNPMWARRYNWARKQACAQRPKTWSALQSLFGRMRFEVGRKLTPQGFQYNLLDHLCRTERNPFDLASYGAPASGPNVLGDLVREWEKQELDTRRQKEQEEAAQIRRFMNRGTRR
jgi:Plasmid recombination enzyme